jgi:alpha-tubulin suppressor-like RCC1 family protein
LDIVDVFGLQTGVAELSAGGLHACAVLTSGQVRCWGGNDYGELGNGASGTYSVKPQVVCTSTTSCTALSDVAQVSAGTSVTCAVSNTGTLSCWGSNLYGRLGKGMAQADTTVAVQVGTGYKKVVVGSSHVCAITATNGLRCWGYNGHGELGDSSKTTRYTPVDVSGLSAGVLDVTLGDTHTCALLSGDTIDCWGYNNKGQLGDGTGNERTSPTPIVGLVGTPIAVAAGEQHTCAVLDDHRVQCWGDNEYGELGDSTNNNVRAAPGFVLQDN